MERPPEFWVGLVAAALYVFRKSEGKSIWMRVVEAGISGGLRIFPRPGSSAVGRQQ